MPPVAAAPQDKPSPAQVRAALLPWVIVCVILLVWGSGWFKNAVNPIFT